MQSPPPCRATTDGAPDRLRGYPGLRVKDVTGWPGKPNGDACSGIVAFGDNGSILPNAHPAQLASIPPWVPR